MYNEDTIMRVDTILPEDFDGTVWFTNWSEEDFVGVWGKKEYHFPAQATSKMVMPDNTPLEILQIRKKFAKDLAEREYFKSEGYGTLRSQEGTPGNRTMNSIHQAGTYSIETLTPYIQKALDPLPVAQALVKKAPEVRLEERITKDEDGQMNTAAIGGEKDLESLAKGTLEEKVLGKTK